MCLLLNHNIHLVISKGLLVISKCSLFIHSGIESSSGVNKPEAWLSLSDFLKILRGSALLSNHLAYAETCDLFNSCQGAHGQSPANEPKQLSLEQFVLLFASVARCNHPEKEPTPLVTGGEYVHEPASEVQLLKQLLHDHLFPSVLQVRTVVGDDEVLEALTVPPVIELLGINPPYHHHHLRILCSAQVQPALLRVFCKYAGTQKLEENTALPLRKLEAFARDFMLIPQVPHTSPNPKP